MRKGRELLHVKGLKVSLLDRSGPIRLVDGVELKVNEGETVSLIGPTAAGKTVTAKAILGLLNSVGGGKPEWDVKGEVGYRGLDLFKLPIDRLRRLRGEEISMISQNPVGALDPTLMIGDQTGESKEARERIERQRLSELVLEYLGKVELPGARKRARFFRHQFSKGEAQRINIAASLICNPSLLIADEPTSNLDVTVQRQVLDLLRRVKEDFGLSMLFITHDLGVVAEMADYVYVMYAGRIIEHGDVHSIFKGPRHPFTRAMLNAVIRMDTDRSRLMEMQGELPIPPYDIPGCAFYPRCEFAAKDCIEKRTVLEEIEPGHYVACSRIDEVI